MAGSAWTNQVVSQILIAGTVPGVLAYNPTIAAGDLIASVSGTQTTDGAPGNEVLAGVVGYTTSGGTVYATQLGGAGLAASVVFYTATTEAGPYTQRGFITGSASGVTVSSNLGLILATGGSAGSITADLSSGLSGGLPVTQLDRSVLAAGNNNTATDITAAWTIPAHDGDNGAKYTIETHVTATTGQTTIETLTLGLDLNAGTLVPLATLGTAFNGGALSTTYEIPVRLHVVPGAGSSASNAQVALSASLADSSVNRLSTNSANMGGRSDTTAFTTTSSNTIALYAVWGGAGGSQQTAGTRWSEFTRSGQN